jgi:hypothetical protein
VGLGFLESTSTPEPIFTDWFWYVNPPAVVGAGVDSGASDGL